MKKLFSYRILLLFVLLFSAAAFLLFDGYLSDVITLLRTGVSSAYFDMAVRGHDGVVYALGRRNGSFIVGLNENGRLFERALSGLPADFEAKDMFVTREGVVLLSLYERSDEGMYCGLYAARDGASFRMLLRLPCEGESYPDQMRSVMLSSISETDGVARFFVKRGNQYERYAYNPEDEGGLVPEGAFQWRGEPVAGIVAADNVYVATVSDELLMVGDFGAATVAEGMLPAKLMAADKGFWVLGARSGVLELFDAGAGASVASYELLRGGLPCAAENASWFWVDPGGGRLVIENGKWLYAVSPDDDAVHDLTPYLYRENWKNIALLFAVAAAVLLLARAFTYLFSEVRKLYFPIVLRQALILSMLTAVLVYATLLYYVQPAARDGARTVAQTTLMTYTAQLAGTQTDMKTAFAHLAEANADFADTEFYLLSAVDGEWRIKEATSGFYGDGFVARTPGMLGFLARGAETLERRFEVMETPGATRYCAFAPASRETVLVAVADAEPIETRFIANTRHTAFFLCGCAVGVIALALLAISAVVRGLRRISGGVDLLRAGRFDVSIIQNSNDELSVLAGSFNGLAEALDKDFGVARRRSLSFMKFVPQQLVTLLGVDSIEDVDKSTTASRDMVMMVVWIGFPEYVYQSEPDAMFDNINEVIGHTSGVVAQKGGTIYNFNYRGYDAVFGAERDAVSAAVEIRQAILSLNDERVARGTAPVTLRIALDKGNMVTGVVGDDSHLVPTVVSACLSRVRTLVSLAEKLDANILCAQVIADAAPEYAVRYIGKMADADQARVYEIFDGDPFDVRTAKETTRSQFSEGVYLFYGLDFSAAKRAFMSIARKYSGDGAARHYLYQSDLNEKRDTKTVGL